MTATTSHKSDVSLKIPVMEAFGTIQGEGFHTGKLAFFIRTGGCDVGCHWCDVKESWPAEAHPPKTVGQICEMLESGKERIVVITGGEPLMYDMDVLTRAIRGSGRRVHLETSGAHPLSGNWDWICFSPKKFKAPREEFYERSHELKIIVFNKADLQWAEEHAGKMHTDARLYLQPEWSRRNEMMPLIVSYVRNNPKWRVSLQTHKYMDIP